VRNATSPDVFVQHSAAPGRPSVVICPERCLPKVNLKAADLPKSDSEFDGITEREEV
jgi:hypothetical protein